MNIAWSRYSSFIFFLEWNYRFTLKLLLFIYSVLEPNYQFALKLLLFITIYDMWCYHLCFHFLYALYPSVLHFLSKYQTKTTVWYYIPCNDPTTLDIWPCSFFYLHFELSIPALSKTAASILECVLRRDPHEAEYIQSIQEVVHSLEPVLVKNTQ